MRRSAFLWTVFLLCAGAQTVVTGQDQPGLPTPPAEDETISAPAPETAAAAQKSDAADRDASLPYTPYPAGLSWVLTPQAFRVPIPDRIYYPPHTYVRRCPYYPRGYYWGANWRFNVIGRGNLLFFGSFRFNPYLTAAKAQHHPELRGQRRYAPPAGPRGQAMLLGAEPMPPIQLPPTVAQRAKTATTGAVENQVATVRRAPTRRTTQAASSRRTALKPTANSR